MPLSRRSGNLLIWGAALCVPLVVFLAPFVWTMFDPVQPVARVLADVASPDGRWIATTEAVDNGLGFGQGMVYYEIHLHRPGQRIADHGDPEASSVFYIEAEGRAPRTRWRDATHLLVLHEVRDRRGLALVPGKQVRRHGDVAIEYVAWPMDER